jgi:hypothetical protein
MGWDTVDELLCKFYNWKVVTDATLQVKHLKPTGQITTKQRVTNKAKRLHFGIRFIITAIASAKLA